MPEPRVFEARRYSAVLINDPDLLDLQSVLGSLRIPPDRVSSADAAAPSWEVVRATMLGAAPYYPPASAPRTKSGSYPTELYVAAQSNEKGPKIFLASPYVRLLASCIGDLCSHLQRDIRFAKPDMTSLFTHFERTRTPQLSATRISVLMEGDVGLEVVSLSGRNPLRSDLRHALLNVASPYSIRVKGTYIDGRGTNIHADRHGNFWWHLTSEASLVNTFAFLNVVVDSDRIATTTSSPLKRAFQDDEIL